MIVFLGLDDKTITMKTGILTSWKVAYLWFRKRRSPCSELSSMCI